MDRVDPIFVENPLVFLKGHRYGNIAVGLVFAHYVMEGVSLLLGFAGISLDSDWLFEFFGHR